MKKIFFALAALVLAFTGCSQEEDAIQVSEKKAVKVVVNMDKPGFGEDTRAPRQGWVDGDNVAVVLKDDLDKIFFTVSVGIAPFFNHLIAFSSSMLILPSSNGL